MADKKALVDLGQETKKMSAPAPLERKISRANATNYLAENRIARSNFW